MPSSQEKIAANQRNALQSTGPRTPSGKRRSSGNAIRHGLCAKRVVLVGESQAEFGDFRDRLWRAIQPANAVEEALVERIVGALWRLRRAVRIENDLFDRAGFQRRLEAFGTGMPPLHELGWNFEAASGATLDRLARYETRLERSFTRALHELQRLRSGEVPHALDVEVFANGASQGAPPEAGSSDDEAQLGFEFEDSRPESPIEGPPRLEELRFVPDAR